MSCLLQLKKVLSSIPEAPLNVECLMNDIDFRGSMTREKFEELAAPILERAKEPLKQARHHFLLLSLNATRRVVQKLCHSVRQVSAYEVLNELSCPVCKGTCLPT